MSHTLTIRIQDDLARWLVAAAAGMGVSQGELVREQLQKARQGDLAGQPFMRLAGTVRRDRSLSTRKGFSRS